MESQEDALLAQLGSRRERCPVTHPETTHRRCERPVGHGEGDDDPHEHWNLRADPALTWWDGATMARTAASWLAIAALGALWDADAEQGCCPACCGPCHALSVLHREGTLDGLVRAHGPGYLWWDETDDQVSERFLHRAWRLTACHADPAPVANRHGGGARPPRQARRLR